MPTSSQVATYDRDAWVLLIGLKGINKEERDDESTSQSLREVVDTES